MSVDHLSERQENESTDVFIAPSSYTAVPNWIATRADISLGARNLAHVILIKARGPLLPTRESLAELLGVDVRTIAGWLNELRAAGVMRTNRAGRRNFFIVSDSGLASIGDPTISDPTISDPTISDPTISDPTISDRGIMGWPHERTHFSSQQVASNGCFSWNPISDRAGGGGGSPFSAEKDSPPTTAPRAKISPHEITAPTGRWMVAEGFSLTKAHQHQSLPLAAAQADYQRRRQLGQGHGAIALAWEVAPPAGDGQAAPLEPIAGEFTFSAHEKERYRAMGFAIGDEQPTEEISHE